MTSLETKLNAILNDKLTNLKPENIKKGVTCLGVTGTLEASTSSGGIKQFSTIKEMNSSTGNTEGDLAIVYRSEVQNATVDSKFQVATFPDTVVLDSAITDYVEVRYTAVDSSVMFDCWGSLDSSMFRMNCYTDSGEIRIQYTSSDGITYTRTDTTGNPVDFGTKIYYENSEMWNDAIGKFIQTGGMYFDGLYDFRNYLDKDYFRFIPISNIDFASGTPVWNGIYTSEKYSVADVQAVVRQMKNDGVISKIYGLHSFIDSDNDLIISENLPDRYIINSSGNLIGMGETTTSSYTYKLYKIDLDRHTYSLKSTKSKVGTLTISNSHYGAFDIITKTIQVLIYVDFSGQDTITRYQDYSGFYLSNSLSGTAAQTSMDFTGSYYDTYNKYQIAPTQLTATIDDVLNKEFYGKNGVEIGTLTTNVSNSFADTNAEVYDKIQKAYDDMTPRVLTDTDKIIDKNIYFIPKKSDGTILLDTSAVTNMQYMFQNCGNLTTIPLLDTSAVTNMKSMFDKCKNLTTIPLLDTSNVTNMSNMFSYCTNLTEIPQLDTSNVTSMMYMFDNCDNLITIPLLNTSKVTKMNQMFYGCNNLTEVPLLDTSKVTSFYQTFDNCSNLTAIPAFDTSNVTEMNYCFSMCTSLVTLPVLNTSKVTDMVGFVSGCPSLSDDSLNNILAMCTNATAYTRTKTLRYMELTKSQADKCTTLSNYSAFTAAGWTTGY